MSMMDVWIELYVQELFILLPLGLWVDATAPSSVETLNAFSTRLLPLVLAFQTLVRLLCRNT